MVDLAEMAGIFAGLSSGAAHVGSLGGAKTMIEGTIGAKTMNEGTIVMISAGSDDRSLTNGIFLSVCPTYREIHR